MIAARISVVAVLGLVIANGVAAQTGGSFELTWSSVDGGGGRIEGGDFVLTAAIGQPDAGDMDGGDFELRAGFVQSASCVTCQLYGDVFPPGGNCLVDVDDLLIVLDGFVNPEAHPEADIFPCGGDGIIDVDDVLAELNAFIGEFACPHPCPP